GEAGQTPVVHPAWSWSPDGTDRFTDSYPGENLFTMDMIYPTPNTGGAIVSGNTVTYPSGGWAYVFMANAQLKELLKPSTTYSVQYVFELLSRAEGTSAYAQNQHGSLLLYSGVAGYSSIDLGNNWYYPGGNANDANTWEVGTIRKRESTFTTPATLYDSAANYRLLYYTLRSVNPDGTLNTYEKGKFYDIKFEENPSPTIYTPAPSEDFADAYPLYEGTHTDYSDTASQNPADYTWRRIIGESGQDGVAGADGKGIKSTAVSYQASASGTTAPTGTWVANPPTVAKGQYLWTRTIWTYTDNATETGYSVAYVAKDGNNGTDGIAGKDGVGIASTVIQYVGSTSGTTKPTAGWTTAIPSVAEGSFLWTKTVWTYSDGTNETGYSVAKMGAKGPTGSKGDTGAQGPKGDTGEQGPPTGVISQSTVPSSPYVGMLWQCTGNIAGYINPATYRWNGSAWTIYQFTAQNILAETFTGFVFQGVEFIGSRFVNEWTDSQAGNTGRMQIADGELTSDYWLTGSSDENNTAGGHFSISRDGILTSTWKNETVN
ncbi:collagen-like triple helix repeat-containing protein, partial [Enterococcus asini]|uniref:collagen-like triple helix repeat-containing protein n=1 Tax=Enterococcus asini TaxID=57732 RepID=UPI001E31632E